MRREFTKEFLIEYMGNNKISAQELGNDIGVYLPTVYNWINGSYPSYNSAIKIINYFKNVGIEVSIPHSMCRGRAVTHVYDTKNNKIIPREDMEEVGGNYMELDEYSKICNVPLNIIFKVISLKKIHGKKIEDLIKIIE